MGAMFKLFFEINKDLKHTINHSPADWYLGMEIQQEISVGGLSLLACSLCQPAYIESICKNNGVAYDYSKDPNGYSNRRLTKTPCTGIRMSVADSPEIVTHEVIVAQTLFRSNVGALLFLARCTMPTIAYGVGVMCRFASCSGPAHWHEMQHLINHIWTVRNMGIRYSYDSENSVMMTNHQSNYNVHSTEQFYAYTDSDFAGCPDTSRSTSGYLTMWMGAAINWGSFLQACVTLSVAEAELVALTKGSQDVIWHRHLFEELGYDMSEATTQWLDSQAALDLIRNRRNHARTKHIRLRQNFTKEQVDAGTIDPQYVPGVDNLSDVLTKAVKLIVLEGFFFAITGYKLRYEH
jgi:hypothetical protein